MRGDAKGFEIDPNRTVDPNGDNIEVWYDETNVTITGFELDGSDWITILDFTGSRMMVNYTSLPMMSPTVEDVFNFMSAAVVPGWSYKFDFEEFLFLISDADSTLFYKLSDTNGDQRVQLDEMEPFMDVSGPSPDYEIDAHSLSNYLIFD